MSRRSLATLGIALVIVVGLLWVRTIPLRVSSTGTPPLSRATLTNAWVIDGDTFDGTRVGGEKVRVRILGIDAPEIAHDTTPADCGGDAAKKALIAMLDGKSVTIDIDPVSGEKDRYGRTLAYVSAAGIDDVGLRMVGDGMAGAWHPASDPAPLRYTSYVAAQDAARTAGKGSWLTCGLVGR